MSSLTNIVKRFAFMLLVIGAVGAGTNIFATHFRYGKLEVTPVLTPGGVPSGTMTFRLEIALRRSYLTDIGLGANPPVGLTFTSTQINAGVFNFGTGATANPTFTVTSIDVANDTAIATANFTFFYSAYLTNPTYTASWGGCCRLSTLLGGQNDTNWNITAIVRPNSLNRAPSSALPPVITVQRAPVVGGSVSFSVPAADQDFDVVRFRLATAAESGVPSQPAGLSINSTTGVVTWANRPTATTLALGLYTAQFVLEDYDAVTLTGPKARTVVDVVLNLVNVAGNAPTSLINGSAAPQSFTVEEGQTVTFTVTGTDPDLDPGSGLPSFVTLTASGVPVGANNVPSLPVTGRSPVNSTFSWVASAVGGTSRVISFTATDATGLQDSNSVTIFIETNKPPTISCSAPITVSANTPTGALNVGVPVTVQDQNNDPLTINWAINGTAQAPASATGTASPNTVTLLGNYGVGTHTVNATVVDPQGLNASCSTTVTVSPATTALAPLTVSATQLVGAVPTVTTTLSRTSAPSGPISGEIVVFTLTSPSSSQTTLSGVTSALGQVSVQFPTLTSRGNYTVSASYAGTPGFNSATSNTATVSVYQPTSLSLAPATTTAGTPVTLSATLTALGVGTPISGQTVNFSFGGVIAPASATTDAAGVASVSVVFPNAGAFTAEASFINAAGFYADSTGAFPIIAEVDTATVSVAPAATSLAPLTVNSVEFVGNTLPVTTTLTRTSAPAGAVSGASVVFTLTNPSSVVTTLVGTTNAVGGVSVIFSSLTIRGVYSVSASYAGSGALSASTSNTATVSVYQRTNLSLAPASGTAGAPISLSATLTAIPGGSAISGQTVDFSFGGVIPPVSATTNAAGVATVSVTFPNAGSFTATASFLNAAGFYADSTGAFPVIAEVDTATVSVAPAATALAPLNVNPSEFVGNILPVSTVLTRTSAPAGPLAGQVVTFTLTDPTSAQTTLTGTTNGVGAVAVAFPPLASRGAYSVSASFAGNGALSAATSNTASVNVYQRTSLSLAPATGIAGAPMTLTATLTAFPGGAAISGQTVNFSFGGVIAPVSATTDGSGAANVVVVFPNAGSFTATASFVNLADFFVDGNGNPIPEVDAASLAIAPAATALADLAVNPVEFVGNTLSVTTSLARISAPSGPVPGATVVFTLTDPSSSQTTVSATTNGTGGVSVTFPLTLRGVHTVSAQYLGSGSLSPSTSNTATVSVYQRTNLSLAPASTIAGVPVTLSATLTAVPGGLPISGQTVDFSFGGVIPPLTGTTNAVGEAMVTAVFPNAGTFPATASFFNAAGFYADSTGSFPVIAEVDTALVSVAPAATSLAPLTVNPIEFVGNTLTVSTTLTRVSAPIGPVAGVVVFTLTDPSSGQTTASSVTAPSGSVAATFSLNMRGNYTVTASFAGSPSLNPATSNTATVAVYQRTNLTISPVSTTAGAPTTVSATLTAVPNGVPVSGQTVDFSFGGVIPAQSAVTDGSGVATIVVTFPDAGTFTATASFLNAPGFYADSTGAFPVIAEVDTASVSVSAASTSVTALAASGVYGGTVMLAANLSRTAAPAGPLSGKTINFSLNGNNVGSGITDVAGLAVVLVNLTSDGSPGGTLINAGSYPTGVGASFAGDLNNSASSDTDSLDVAKADTTTVTTCPATVIFNAAAQEPCTASVTGAGGLSETATVTYADNENVGTATATGSYAGGTNHNPSSDVETFAILKANTTTTITCSNAAYNGSAHETCLATVTGPGLSQPVTVTYTNNVNAGTATANATYPESANHNSSSDTETFTIAKADTTTVTTCPVSVVYNGAAQTPCTANVTGPGGLNSPTSVTYADNVNAGTATATGSYAGDDNYNPSSDAKSFAITAAAVNATAGSGSNVYDGATHTPSPCTISGSYTGSLSCANSPATVGPGVGTTVINPVTSGSDLANFIVTPIAGSYTISPAEVIASAGSGSNVYDGATHSPSACVVSGAYTGSLSCANSPATVGPGVGTTAISPVVSGADLANFTVSSVNGSYTISPASVTATAGSGANVYDGATHSPSGCIITGAYTGSLSCANDPATVGPGVGTTTINPVTSGPDLANFTVNPISGSYTITPAEVTARAGSGSNVYDGATHSPGACTVSGAYIGGLSCLNNPVTVGPGVGTTAISPVTSGADIANFTVISVDGSYTITPAEVTAMAGSGSNVYDGATHSPGACAVTGTYIGGLSCVNDPSSVGPGVGTTTISPVTSGADIANFTITSVDGSYTISPAAVTATGGSGSNVYDGATHSPSGCVVTGDYIGGLSCVNSPPTVGPGVGTTAISPVTSGADLANFIVTPVPGSYTITPAEVIVTAGSGSNVYDGATHSPSACVVTGAYVGGLSCSNSPATVGPDVGTTAISPVVSGADLANFTVTSIAGSYSISPAEVTATGGSGSNVYDGATHAPSACAVTGAYIGGLSCTNNPASVGPGVGTTTISPVVSGVDLANFNVTNVDGSYTISPAEVTASAGSGSNVYDGATHSPSACAVTGAYIGGLSCANSPATVGPGVGTTTIIPVTSGADLANFTVTAVNGSYSITPAPSVTVVTCSPSSLVYNALPQTPCSVSITGAGGLNLTATPSYVNNVNVGTATASYTYPGDANHTGSAGSRTFTITQAPSAITVSAPAYIANGGSVAISGVLTGVASAPLGGENVTFSIGSGAATQSCTAITNAAGSAGCTISGVNQPLGPALAVNSAFAGNSNYFGAGASTTTLVFAYAAGNGGAFVIGNGNSALGQNVTYWGSQWANRNVLTGGSAPNSFKGFANRSSTTPASVGATWTTDPGNSSNPPPTVPTYMAVIVSSAITKSGSIISGNTTKIAIVRTNAGYQPNPGNAGTGTIVAVLP